MKSDLTDAQINALKEAAQRAKNNAYAPYSQFRVGAALLTQSGKIVQGCNVENASFGATVCAERTAIASACAQGETEFKAICVVGDTDQPITPCGICRQTLIEFGSDLVVICCNADGDYTSFYASELLPSAFKL